MNAQNQNTTATTSTEATMATIANLINNGDVAAIMVVGTNHSSNPYPAPEELVESIFKKMEPAKEELVEPETTTQEELVEPATEQFRMDEQFFRPTMSADMVAENVLRMFAPIRESKNIPLGVFHRLMAKYAVSGGCLIVESSSENGVFDKHAVSPVDPGSLELWKDWTTYSQSFQHISQGGDISPAKWMNGAIELRSNMGRVTHVIRVGQL